MQVPGLDGQLCGSGAETPLECSEDLQLRWGHMGSSSQQLGSDIAGRPTNSEQREGRTHEMIKRGAVHAADP